MARQAGRSQKVTSSTGASGKIKRDGYAAGAVPASMVGTKVGKTEKTGYSGPNVARGPVWSTGG